MKKHLLSNRMVLISVMGILGIAVSIFATIPIHVRANIVENVRKTTDQTVIGNTFTDDNELVLPLRKNRSYIIDGGLFVSGVASGCQIALDTPQGSVIKIGFVDVNQGGYQIVTSDSQPQIINCPENASSYTHLSGTIEMGAIDGNLQLQLAPLEVGEEQTIEEGSFIRADEL